MKSVMAILCLLQLMFGNTYAQDQMDELNNVQLEDLTESDEAESEDDYNLQQLLHYKKHPVNINGDKEELIAFPLFDALVVENILQYRRILGDLISIYELQAVPGITVDQLSQMEEYITVDRPADIWSNIKQRMQNGNGSLTIRPVLITQPMHGFVTDKPDEKFLGDRLALLMRFKYHYRNLLQYGITVDKDAGEQMFRQINRLVDFYSAHLFVRNSGIFKAIALGDYTVNMGQGLIQWQSQAFKKSSGVLNIKRQSEMFKPYQSAGENNFFRGVGGVIKLQRLEPALFVSYRKLTANVTNDDQWGPVISSFNTSGLHRSQHELADRFAAGLISAGGALKWRGRTGHIALNLLSHHYSAPVKKRDEPYNVFSMRGREWQNASLDFTQTIKNFHLFGELAIDKRRSHAMTTGLITSINRIFDLSVLIRNMEKDYQAVYGNAFTENTLPGNETGYYTGICYRMSNVLRIEAYGDIFKFPWLKYRVNAPSSGFGYLAQLTWKPSKRTEYYIRCRSRIKPLNTDDDMDDDYQHKDYVESSQLINYRSHLNHHITKAIIVRTRVEFCRYQPSALKSFSNGYLFYSDLIFKPLNRWYRFNIRVQYFEAENYNTRIYAFENDVLFASSTPAFFNKGVRTYTNLMGKIRLNRLKNSALVVSIKVSNTLYNNIPLIGSGTSSIPGSVKTDVRFQVFLTR